MGFHEEFGYVWGYVPPTHPLILIWRTRSILVGETGTSLSSKPSSITFFSIVFHFIVFFIVVERNQSVWIFWLSQLRSSRAEIGLSHKARQYFDQTLCEYLCYICISDWGHKITRKFLAISIVHVSDEARIKEWLPLQNTLITSCERDWRQIFWTYQYVAQCYSLEHIIRSITLEIYY